jgi:dimethylhistidine N-methyltransferase
MPMFKTEAIAFHDHHPEATDFRRQVLEGLCATPKRLSPKFFYDKRGSELFDAICELPEYYPTRTEIAILEAASAEIAALLGENCLLIEYGSGSSRKIRILLDALAGEATYVAIDISREHLLQSASDLAVDYPDLEVIAVCADYSKPFPLPRPSRRRVRNRVVFFPGSTIGNFTPAQAAAFLRTTARQVGPGGSMLIGVDLKKDERILRAAYNDSEQVTAAFNLNLLERINRELNGDFEVSNFEHRAHYNAQAGRVEMHLVSRCAQSVRLDGHVIPFAEGETIHTENSYKFSVEEFSCLAQRGGFAVTRVWTDPDKLFSLQYLTVPGEVAGRAA